MNVDKTHEWTNQQILRLYDIIEDLKAENAELKAKLADLTMKFDKVASVYDDLMERTR